MKAWHNGRFVDWEETNVSLLSHGFSRGSSLFEVADILKSERGTAVFGLQEHIDRLYNSAKLSFMEIPLSAQELKQQILETIKFNNVKQGILKFFAYYPDIEMKVTPRNPSVALTIFALDADQMGINKEILSTPVTAHISKFRKTHPESIPIHAKICGNYVNPYIAKMEALKKGYDEVIMIDTMGFVAEGSTANLFLIADGKAVTAGLRSVLSGITRKAVIEVLASIGVEVEERDITTDELMQCDEAFFTSSIVKVQPVLSIDGTRIGSSCPGEVTESLQKTMNSVYSGTLKTLEHWLTYV